MKKKNYQKIINEIEKVRKKNNKNWMDILRLAFKSNPKQTAKIFSKIYKEDSAISKLSKKFTKSKILYGGSVNLKNIKNLMRIDNKKFSRVKYEKFLLENNLSASTFENSLKKQELKENLFNYISGGIKSPYFLKNKIYINETTIDPE